MIRVTATFVLLATSSLAKSDEQAWPLTGSWCTGNETMLIESTGIGFNEHTFCDVENLPITLDSADSWRSPVACRTVHLADGTGEGEVELVEQPVEGLTQMTLFGAADGTLVLGTDTHKDEMHFLPCSHFQ
ncbi:hypothetical protein SAMN05444287_0091 [Octadecabacter temperatus]|uniref:Uncharacterized protein n=1 Tax=Octadecabacter temperatus TaxID=1458307 RepID=A0A0K0Y243_9RHOB|nr:hypothetical protein [Octadecabacter temperatus]AKS45004.1 hypothetical protein OSB_04400 [Octadecabacter temperatus]SIN84293.1 hypothetical protein SAMN05444287_0091 [Octadecabacter temperatus]